MVEYWDVVTDRVSEVLPSPSAVTRITAYVPEQPGETVNEWQQRAHQEILDYSDPEGYSIQAYSPHPLNSMRGSRGYRAIFQKDHAIEEDTQALGLFTVTLNWASDYEVVGMPTAQDPPASIQHSVNLPITRSPNTGKFFTTTAGEPIRNFYREKLFGGLSYSILADELPTWFDDAQGGCINKRPVRLKGKLRPKLTVWCNSCTSSPERAANGTWKERINLTVLFHPDTWLEPFLNAGYYERKLVAETIPSNPRQKPQSFDLTELVANSKKYDRLIRAARSGRPYVYNARISLKVRQVYAPIQNFFGQPTNYRADIKDVDQPAPLHAAGVAIRDEQDGAPLRTTNIPLNWLHVLRLDPDKQVDMSRWGLW